MGYNGRDHPQYGGSPMQKNYRKTLIACYLGFITQAISAKKLDGTNYTYTAAWAHANSFEQ